MVKQISLNDQDETVRRFFEELPTEPDGALVELHGRCVYLFVKPAMHMEPPDEPWTDAKNRRRAELVDKEIAGTLIPAEVLELASLQQQMIRYVDRVAPLPIEEARKLHRMLLEKSQSQARDDNRPV